ncbi:MAG TPA: group 1 truncated hemoglobin [Candidatus Nitrosotenuis sp.]|jgi:hemoglobin|nr:group 1 truncated hemoglobin [Candidatus Nitrosotenuis sp.]
MEDTLYHRLGGYDACAAMVAHFWDYMHQSERLRRFLYGLNDLSKARVRQHTVDFVVHSLGGPTLYTGHDMYTAHKGLNVTEEDWEEAQRGLQQAMAPALARLSPEDREFLANWMAGLKSHIVEPGAVPVPSSPGGVP